MRPDRSQCRWLILALGLIVVTFFAGAVSAADAPSRRTELELEKLRQEIRQLQIENDRSEGFGAFILRWGPFLTVVGGVATVLVAVRKEVRDQRRERAADRKQREDEAAQRLRQYELDRQQRENELKQQQVEAQRRFDELFGQAVANLGSENESVQLSAVVLLESFLRGEDPTFHEQIYSIMCRNLALPHTPRVNRFLVHAFEKAIRLRLARQPSGAEPLDLANCQLPRVDLSGLQLDGADVAFAHLTGANLVGARLVDLRGVDVTLERARLSRADLTDALLHGAQCRGAAFHEARMVSTKLRPSKKQRADLSQAEFFGAELQSAHLDGAKLTGARFDGANLADTFFRGATLDRVALASILNAANVGGRSSWRLAHFDADVRRMLEELDGGDGGDKAHG